MADPEGDGGGAVQAAGAASSVETACRGLEPGARPDPCTLVIFGASGDLTQRELIPALYELARQGLLPDPFAVVGVSRTRWSDDEFRARMREAVRSECAFDDGSWRRFAPRLHYQPGDITAPAGDDYAVLKGRLEGIRAASDAPDNVLFHLAIAPGLFPTIVERLSRAGLATGDGWRRLVIEKPFGEDRASALALDDAILAVFDERQVYRIDHFLGKETVQNLLVFRFANPSFEPIWNRNYVDHVQITVAEDIGIGSRAAFYEKTGVVRDMVQNHLLQLLCMAAIEPPVHFNGPSLRDETAKVLEAVAPLDLGRCIRGQYGAGTVRGEGVVAYRGEAGVADDSNTPTYAALELTVNNWRWAGVPFYLRTGKRMARKLTEVSIHFKATPHLMFPVARKQLHANVLAFRLQPEEGIFQTFAAKRPGPSLSIQPVQSSFRYASAFGVKEPPRAYAWLLLDAMEGDQTLFARSDWIAAAWSIVDPLVEYWESTAPADFPNYRAGSWGPSAAHKLLRRAGRRWEAI